MNQTSRFSMACASALAIAAMVSISGCSCQPAAAAPLASGQDLYGSCDACHGEHGEGKPFINAPTIAGLPKWYVVAQLQKFRTGLRGAHPDDPEGLRMRPMSRQMASAEEIDAVATFVSQLHPVPQPASFNGGDAAAGKAAYAVCAACHGADGKGVELLKGPPLAGQYDWYLMSQVHKFKNNIRGINPGDLTGNQMRPMAMTLADDQSIKNVLAYISSLPR